MARWGLTTCRSRRSSTCGCARCHRLERDRDQKELAKLGAELSEIEGLLASDDRQWRTLATEVEETRTEFGGETPLGRRRTVLGGDAGTVEIPAAALVEREPITVLRRKRAGFVPSGSRPRRRRQKYKEGDGPRLRCRPRPPTGSCVCQQRALLHACRRSACRAGVDRASRCA